MPRLQVVSPENTAAELFFDDLSRALVDVRRQDEFVKPPKRCQFQNGRPFNCCAKRQQLPLRSVSVRRRQMSRKAICQDVVLLGALFSNDGFNGSAEGRSVSAKPGLDERQ